MKAIIRVARITLRLELFIYSFQHRSAFLLRQLFSRQSVVPGFPNFTATFSRKGNIFLM